MERVGKVSEDLVYRLEEAANIAAGFAIPQITKPKVPRIRKKEVEPIAA